jgi:hypothetical protein
MSGEQDNEAATRQAVTSGRDAYVAGHDLHVHLPSATPGSSHPVRRARRRHCRPDHAPGLRCRRHSARRDEPAPVHAPQSPSPTRRSCRLPPERPRDAQAQDAAPADRREHAPGSRPSRLKHCQPRNTKGGLIEPDGSPSDAQSSRHQRMAQLRPNHAGHTLTRPGWQVDERQPRRQRRVMFQGDQPDRTVSPHVAADCRGEMGLPEDAKGSRRFPGRSVGRYVNPWSPVHAR